jgi:predicted dehydrogenase
MSEARPGPDQAASADPRKFNRRTIAMVGRVAMTAAAAQVGQRQALIRGDLKAAILGATGRGDYGHELDFCLSHRDDIELVAIADADQNGLLKVANHLKPRNTYLDYRELLAVEKPQLVVIAPRHADQHHDMARAAIAAGAHVLLDKPYTCDLIEADAVNAAAERARVRVAVAHQMRLAPNIVYLHDIIDGGLIGDLLEIRAWGKQDHRAGGEDMMVLGVHQFDLMRLFAGDPLWCSARVTHEGRDITSAAAFVPRENVGRVAGDEISAQFAFANGVQATWTSRHRLREQTGNWAVELHGSAGSARINCDVPPRIYVARRSAWDVKGRTESWEPLMKDPIGIDRARRFNFSTENARLVDDWIDAVRCAREPVANATNATKAIEMVMAVYQSALSGNRVGFPLSDRRHPLRPEPPTTRRMAKDLY